MRLSFLSIVLLSSHIYSRAPTEIQKSWKYIPKPFDTASIELPNTLRPLLEKLAQNTHDSVRSIGRCEARDTFHHANNRMVRTFLNTNSGQQGKFRKVGNMVSNMTSPFTNE